MYVSFSQIITSLERLGDVHPFFGYAFLGFKKAKLPVGRTQQFNYTYIRENILETHFKVGGQPGYFNPFKSTTRWVAPRYESTSLQRVIADTFATAFIHSKGSSEWGWKPDYVDRLMRTFSRTHTRTIPIVDLSVWLYRNEPFDNIGPEILVKKFIDEFHISPIELAGLFDDYTTRTIETAAACVSDIDILNAVGWPDGSGEKSGVLVDSLTLSNVGPAKEMLYDPRSRLNLITGDNSVGKTFLLDCIWWAITGRWMSFAADPLSTSRVSRSEIGFALSSGSGRKQTFSAPYNPIESTWQRPDQPFQGLALYSDYSGGAAIWDPLASDTLLRGRASSYIRLTKDEIWNGATREVQGRRLHVSNGMIVDWANWIRAPEHQDTRVAFEACLRHLSPPDGQHLTFGKRTASIPGDSRDIPTIRMSYGDVPILYASAGIQRILTLSYMLVWNWSRHLALARQQRREPLRTMVVLIDEIEAHLHPLWQRQIVPALVNAIQTMQRDVSVQIHVSTHSPLVLASAEPIFDADRDQIHNLKFVEGEVRMDEYTVWKHGSVNSWLESEVFGLPEARSKPAEIIIERAMKMQQTGNSTKADIERVQNELVRLLPDDDPFWPRWISFYEGKIKTSKNRKR